MEQKELVLAVIRKSFGMTPDLANEMFSELGFHTDDLLADDEVSGELMRAVQHLAQRLKESVDRYKEEGRGSADDEAERLAKSLHSIVWVIYLRGLVSGISAMTVTVADLMTKDEAGKDD